jgi:type IV secretory pathway component VirB8
MIKNKLITPLNQWLGINRELKLYQIATVFLSIVTLKLGILIFVILNPDPIVIHNSGNTKSYFLGKHQSFSPNQEDVKEFLIEFIKLRFEIKKDDLAGTIRNIQPLSTEGYIQALESEIKRDKSDSPLTKIEQYVANIETIVNEKEALAKFDKIVRFNGIPLIVPTEASFQLIKEKPTNWNPYGILVNGVIEHEIK